MTANAPGHAPGDTPSDRVVGPVEARLRAARESGRKLLVPYVTAGLGEDWTEVLVAVAGAGADAIEVGIPFSDPVMDGPVIQEASRQALEAGATPGRILSELARLTATGWLYGVPLVVMTYYNLAFHAGLDRFASDLAASGVSGAILPDLPLDEAGDWLAAAERAGVEAVLLAAPTTPDERLVRICRASRGWVYAVGRLGVTGERSSLATTVEAISTRLKACSDIPVLVGVGVSTPAQAAEAARHADGVIVGSALVRRVLEGGGPAAASEFVAELRRGLDAVRST